MWFPICIRFNYINPMYLTGFADEAGDSIDDQILATRELGWSNIESRNIDQRNIHDIPDAEFDAVCAKLDAAGIKINCFGSAIANWGKKITEPYETSLAEVRRAIPRMKRLGTKLVRIMSFAVLDGRNIGDQMEEERYRRLREIRKMFDDEGLVPVHENCMNFGGMGWTCTQRLLENVPGLKLVFDTGNPVFNPDYIKPEPRPRQSSWEFYEHVRDHVVYFHIKDGIWKNDKEGITYTMPGDGQGEVKRIMADAIKRGYDGGISIEPHLSVVFHDKEKKGEKEVRYANYVEYGRRMKAILVGLGSNPG